MAARLTGYKIDIKSESQQRELNAAALESAMGEIENYPVDEEAVEEAIHEIAEAQSAETTAEEAIATEEAASEGTEAPADAEEGEGV
ncbi:hypothetical protein D3C87_1764610 [compost metagenome]